MGNHLQLVEQMFANAVTESMTSAVLTDADQAAVLLARRYARAIDQAADRDQALKDYGPKLLAVLAQLRCTPLSRGAAKPAPSRGGRLAAIRDARAAG